jgi:hypothetical protein
MPEQQIGNDLEITAEMIEAGVDALASWDLSECLPSTVAVAVFEAMLAARPIRNRSLAASAPRY